MLLRLIGAAVVLGAVAVLFGMVVAVLWAGVQIPQGK